VKKELMEVQKECIYPVC